MTPAVVASSASKLGLALLVTSGSVQVRSVAAARDAREEQDRAIMRQGRWRSRGMVDRYVRNAKLLDEDNAASGIGL